MDNQKEMLLIEKNDAQRLLDYLASKPLVEVLDYVNMLTSAVQVNVIDNRTQSAEEIVSSSMGDK